MIAETKNSTNISWIPIFVILGKIVFPWIDKFFYPLLLSVYLHGDKYLYQTQLFS